VIAFEKKKRGKSRLSYTGAARPAGDIPSALDPPASCRFHTRCPHVMEVCRAQEPLLCTTAKGHQVACHLTESA
jgi:oligopeptide/dipeptide ABC transporter ATP-binding protein